MGKVPPPFIVKNIIYTNHILVPNRFIFLFRWTEDRRARRKVVETAAEIFVKDEETINSIFFAQQVGMSTQLIFRI